MVLFHYKFQLEKKAMQLAPYDIFFLKAVQIGEIKKFLFYLYPLV